MHYNLTADDIRHLMINSWFGVLTRGALDLALARTDWRGKAVVYFDVDNLKQANDRWGKEESSRRIRAALAWRASDIGCWFSGDEFVAVVPVEDALGFARRVLAELQAQQMSATIVILTGPSGPADIDRAETLVSAAKAERRGAIYVR